MQSENQTNIWSNLLGRALLFYGKKTPSTPINNEWVDDKQVHREASFLKMSKNITIRNKSSCAHRQWAASSTKCPYYGHGIYNLVLLVRIRHPAGFWIQNPVDYQYNWPDIFLLKILLGVLFTEQHLSTII